MSRIRLLCLPAFILPAFILPASILLGSPCVAAENEVANRIAEFIGPRTFAVGHLDVSKVDVDGVLDLVEAGGTPVPEEGRAFAKTRIRLLVDEEASDLFVLMGWDDLAEGRPVLVIPAKRAGAVGLLADLFPGEGTVVEFFRGAVVIGPKNSVARLRSQKPVARPDLAAALAEAGDAAMRFVVACGPDERRVLRAMLPALPPPFGERPRTSFTEAEWFVVAGDLPPKRGVRLVASMPSDESAAAMLELFRDGLAALGNRQGDAHSPEFARLARTLGAKREDRRVVLAVETEAGIRELLASLVPPAERAHRELVSSRQGNTLRNLGLAFHNYADANRTKKNESPFPARANVDAAGKPLLSWRVHVLPYLDQQQLYSEFRLDEPWDSPHNKALLPKMPKLYHVPGCDPGTTPYVVPVGKGTIFETFERTKMREITDGTSVTLLIVAAANESAVPWTKPADWELDFERPTRGLVAPKGSDFVAVFADGALHRLPADIAPEKLRALLTMAGGEVVGPD